MRLFLGVVEILGFVLVFVCDELNCVLMALWNLIWICSSILWIVVLWNVLFLLVNYLIAYFKHQDHFLVMHVVCISYKCYRFTMLGQFNACGVL